MALRPIEKLRFVLSIPTIVILYVVITLTAYAPKYLTAVLRWYSQGAKEHVFRPLVIANRFVQGKPTWTPDDTIHLGWQPFTRAQRELAAMDATIEVHDCGREHCTENGRYVQRKPEIRVVGMEDIHPSVRAQLAAEIKRVESESQPPDRDA